MRSLLTIACLLCSFSSCALGPRNACSNEADIGKFSALVRSEVHELSSTGQYKYTVPKSYGEIWEFAVAFLVVTMDNESTEALRVPVHHEIKADSASFFFLHAPSAASVKVFVSYTKYPGQVVFDAPYCEFMLPFNA